MLIDWFTIGAQALNFLILVWLLKRFLYKPILHAIDAREKRIAAELADADAKKTEAQKERDDFQRRNKEFAENHEARLSKAMEEVEAERRRLLDEAREDADLLRAKRLETLQDEQLGLSREITRRTREEVFAITRKALADLADESLEERMAGMFIRRLRTLSSEEQEHLASALGSSPAEALIRSAFELLPAQRTALESAVKETFAVVPHFRFETAPEIVSGIELAMNGHKVAWSISDYVTRLEKSITEVFDEGYGVSKDGA